MELRFVENLGEYFAGQYCVPITTIFILDVLKVVFAASSPQVAMDEGSFGDAITAYHRLIDLRHKHIDSQVLGMLTKAVSENLPDSKNCGAARFRKDLLTLFGRVTATVGLTDSVPYLLVIVTFCAFVFQDPSDADNWRHYANLILNSDAEMDPVQFQRVGFDSLS